MKKMCLNSYDKENQLTKIPLYTLPCYLFKFYTNVYFFIILSRDESSQGVKSCCYISPLVKKLAFNETESKKEEKGEGGWGMAKALSNAIVNCNVRRVGGGKKS